MADFTAREKQAEAHREVSYRRRVYARMVADGRMTQQKADRAIAIMEQIAADYGLEAEAEYTKTRLI